jgi:ADP-heptose:LPS heptosyltransferase
MIAESPALVFLNGIGDHLINLPAIRAIADLFPGILQIICRTGAAGMFSDVRAGTIHEIHWGLDQRDQVLASDHVTNILTPCDLLVSLNPWHTEAVDRMLDRIKPAHSVGFFPAFATHVPLNFEKHSAELAYDIPRALGTSVSIRQFSEPPRLPEWATAAAAKLLELLPSNSRIIAIHPETLSEKMWNIDKFCSFVDNFLERNSDFFALIISLTDLSLDRGRHAGRVIPCHGISFFTSAALVASADIFVGVDSCMLHVADIFRVPGVGLFGPTNPAEFGFRLTTSRHVSGRGTMDGIDVSQVISAVDELQRDARVGTQEKPVRRLEASH